MKESDIIRGQNILWPHSIYFHRGQYFPSPRICAPVGTKLLYGSTFNYFERA